LYRSTEVPATKATPATQHVLFNVGDTLLIHVYPRGGRTAGAGGGKSGGGEDGNARRVLSFPGTFITVGRL
jgi:hypothetical protein